MGVAPCIARCFRILTERWCSGRHIGTSVLPRVAKIAPAPWLRHMCAKATPDPAIVPRFGALGAWWLPAVNKETPPLCITHRKSENPNTR
ncbi:hypothetical protein OL67_002857 [Phaeobacter piscinae]|nr:hypothetical protein OL67_002857 [Phaeobacter piscinae]